MTAKDYVAIGGVLAGEWALNPTAQLWAITLSIADKFAQDNDLFNREKFYEYVFGDKDHFKARERLKVLA